MSVQWSRHAKRRASERFPGIDLDAAYHAARPAGHGTKRKIREQCPKSARRWMAHGYVGRFYLVTRDWIVFVVQATHRGPRTVVTVFQLDRPEPSRPAVSGRFTEMAAG